MSIHKPRKSETSPIGNKPHQKREQRVTIQLSQKNLESLQCFMPKRSTRQDIKKQSRIKSVSGFSLRAEPPKASVNALKETDQIESTIELPPPCSRPQERSKEHRKKDASHSPDISKLIMNEVIHEIEKEGIRSRWKEDQQLHNGNRMLSPVCQLDRNNTPEEVQRIWLKHNRSHLSTDYSYYSNTAYMMPPQMEHHMSYSSFSNSFNNSFTYSSDDQLYPDYYNDCKNDNTNKRIFQINYNNIEKDGRTTVMIKNIPNKYSLKLLAEEVDQQHPDSYDFLYLPFDYNNNCNVGYAFINFLSPKYIKSFYETFNQKKWSKFKSLKICVLTYARLQGRQSLIEHFYNSKVLNQKEKRYRPIIKDFAQLSDLLEKQRQNQRDD